MRRPRAPRLRTDRIIMGFGTLHQGHPRTNFDGPLPAIPIMARCIRSARQSRGRRVAAPRPAQADGAPAPRPPGRVDDRDVIAGMWRRSASRRPTSRNTPASRGSSTATSRGHSAVPIPASRRHRHDPPHHTRRTDRSTHRRAAAGAGRPPPPSAWSRLARRANTRPRTSSVRPDRPGADPGEPRPARTGSAFHSGFTLTSGKACIICRRIADGPGHPALRAGSSGCARHHVDDPAPSRFDAQPTSQRRGIPGPSRARPVRLALNEID